MLIAAPADSRIEASCAYARSSDVREEQRRLTFIEQQMTGTNTWMGVDQADSLTYAIAFGLQVPLKYIVSPEHEARIQARMNIPIKVIP